jgi:hypothetical protein
MAVAREPSGICGFTSALGCDTLNSWGCEWGDLLAISLRSCVVVASQ